MNNGKTSCTSNSLVGPAFGRVSRIDDVWPCTVRAEIERSKELLSRATSKSALNSSRPHQRRQLGTDDPKVKEVIKFYEDMSSLLVTNVKFEDIPDSDEHDIVFHCIYTHYEMTRRDDDVEGERTNEKSK